MICIGYRPYHVEAWDSAVLVDFCGFVLSEVVGLANSIAGSDPTPRRKGGSHYIASIEARVVKRSFLLPNLEIWRKASTP